jgi:hypothetical protein
MMNKTQQIARGWVTYAWQNKLKAGTKKYAEVQHAYVNGAHAILREETPPIITIYLMTGRDIADLDNSMDEESATA